MNRMNNNTDAEINRNFFPIENSNFHKVTLQNKMYMLCSNSRMKNLSHGNNVVTLKTLKELKKTSMKYFLEDKKWNFPS